MPLDVTQDKIKSVQIRPWGSACRSSLFTNQTKAVLLAFRNMDTGQRALVWSWKLGGLF